ncbi:sulfate transporter family protein [Afifella sp. IM 167]|uniref:sulfate transporter family protein n=1 Tax=Afifella sp. IM 167 TaxID=2033586 RepID=UPI001CC98AEC|nr:sulfate transporter family protein [Afifella sp. IM 167]MBZ8133549.1 cysteine biosynthesis protein CysZ [Afifella sp. IM 167]
MLSDAQRALDEILSPPFRTVLWKSVGLTVALLFAIWLLVEGFLVHSLALPYGWLETGIEVFSGLTLIVGLAFLIAPATSLFAGIFLDDIAEVVETQHYPDEPPGRPLSILEGLATTLQFTAIVVAVNLVALPLVLFLGFGVVIFFVANGYLLGREYFDLAARRFHDRRTAKILRLRHSGRIFLAGLVIAGFTAVPILNFLAPLFATAFMVHVQKRIQKREEAPDGILAPGRAGLAQPATAS